MYPFISCFAHNSRIFRDSVTKGSRLAMTSRIIFVSTKITILFLQSLSQFFLFVEIFWQSSRKRFNNPESL